MIKALNNTFHSTRWGRAAELPLSDSVCVFGFNRTSDSLQALSYNRQVMRRLGDLFSKYIELGNLRSQKYLSKRQHL